MKKNEPIVIGGFLLIVGLSLGIVGCQKKNNEELSSFFTVTRPWREKVEITQQYVAQIRGIQHIEIRSFEKGYLQNIFVDEGQTVSKGEKMFQIMPYLANAEFKKAKAEYEISKIELSNTEKLAKENVVSANELALAKAKCAKFTAELDLAKTHLDMTTIKAPFAGVVDRFQVRLGSLLEEGELLTTLSDIDKLWVYFNLSESDYLNYMKTYREKNAVSTVRLLLADGKPYKYPGQIDTIEADFNNETGNIPFRATFPNPEHLLRHGETGNILLTKTIDSALVVPQKATFEVLDKKYVYVVNEKGVVDVREIVVDKEVSHLFVIKSGVSEQNTILLEGIGKLSKGDVVRTKLIAKSEVLQGLELKVE
jgi:membrane fusion protein (multidrug efflux system)